VRIVARFIIAISFPIYAQMPTSELFGTVRDSHQAPLSGVSVHLTNQSNRSEIIVYTDKDGYYRTVSLNPPSYSAEFSHDGFQSVVKRDLIVAPSQPLRLDIELHANSGRWSIPTQGTLAFLFITALVPSLVTLFITEPGRKLLRLLVAPLRWTKDKAFEFLAPRFPDWIGLPGYKKRVKRSPISRIENPVGPQEVIVPLEQAFAPLMLMSSDSQDRIELFAFSANHKRFIVLGGPGTGKTTLMKSIVVNILNRRANEQLNRLIPIFVVLREMAAAEQTVDEAILATLASFGFKDGSTFVDSALESGRLLIILDGLDEVGVSREPVAEHIRRFCLADDQRSNQNHIIVTCRENSYRTRDLSEVIPVLTRVEPFSPQHMRTFLQGWPAYKGRFALRLYNSIQADPQIRDVCRNPLLLTILTGLYLEKDRFDLPSSRDSFYRSAIDELLVQRPARRAIRQKFDDELKWQMLQRVSLERLEVVAKGEDPELLSRERLLHFAKEASGGELKGEAFQAFLDEVVYVNGIIKFTHEGGYVLGHRTFQEYFGAREAQRIRQPSQVVERFVQRSELSEVLCFYCGLLRNIPQINSILIDILQSGDVLLAGKCLLNATEIPGSEVVQTVTERLFAPISTSAAYSPEVELLSSLSQRGGSTFDIARQRFSEAIDLLAGNAGEGGALNWVSTLSSTPPIATRLLPGLLSHSSATVRIAAVHLLHDLGTEEALDQLIQMLNTAGQPERAYAAGSIADLIRVRKPDIVRRENLIDDREDNNVWPYGSHFSARMGTRIVESIAEVPVPKGPSVRNRCVNEAVRRLREGNTLQRTERRWQNVERDILLNKKRAYLCRTLYRCIYFCVLLVALIGLSVAIKSIIEGRFVTLGLLQNLSAGFRASGYVMPSDVPAPRSLFGDRNVKPVMILVIIDAVFTLISGLLWRRRKFREYPYFRMLRLFFNLLERLRYAEILFPLSATALLFWATNEPVGLTLIAVWLIFLLCASLDILEHTEFPRNPYMLIVSDLEMSSTDIRPEIV